MTEKDDALLKIPSEVPSGKDVPFQDITVMSFSEAKALDDITLGAHVFALGSEFVKRAGSAIKFVQIHRSAIQELRKRYSKQGRRSPVPGCPSWGEFVTSVFKVSQQYMNSLLVSPYPKQLGAKKPAKKKDAAVSTAITEVTMADGVGDTRPEAASLNQTAAQAVACVAVKLAKLVAGNHGGSKTAKAFAQEIVDVDDTDGMLFLPTEVNITSNLSVIQRVWTKLFQDGRYTMPPAAKKGVISRFVNELNNDDFELVATAVAVRIGRIGKEKAKETGESAAKVQEATRVEAATERVRESIAVSVAQTDETEKAAASAG